VLREQDLVVKEEEDRSISDDVEGEIGNGHEEKNELDIY
jgi:hypothetical protein